MRATSGWRSATSHACHALCASWPLTKLAQLENMHCFDGASGRRKLLPHTFGSSRVDAADVTVRYSVKGGSAVAQLLSQCLTSQFPPGTLSEQLGLLGAVSDWRCVFSPIGWSRPQLGA